jgi:hypothetical protein
MPDLGQEEQTCLPTSTANLIVWFGTHGYPKLIVSGDSRDNGYAHTVHALMTATNAIYALGTRTEAITYGIEKYIHDAGYSCDVEYRGLDWSQAKYPQIVKDEEGEKYKEYAKTPSPFTQDWLQENNDPNKGFILLLAYCKFDRASNTFTDAFNAGHAVTLVNAEPDLILIHDPAHYNDEPGRKILTPEPLVGGTFQLPGYSARGRNFAHWRRLRHHASGQGRLDDRCVRVRRAQRHDWGKGVPFVRALRSRRTGEFAQRGLGDVVL